METINYEKALLIDQSSDVNVKQVVEDDGQINIGVIITYGSNDYETITGKLLGKDTVVALSLKVGVPHRFRFSQINNSGTTTNNIHLIGV